MNVIIFRENNAARLTKFHKNIKIEILADRFMLLSNSSGTTFRKISVCHDLLRWGNFYRYFEGKKLHPIWLLT